ncbi:hereditary hemochromatosis protein homolog [Pagrus major]|uniref:hereditary hemochromatosis protein homolog n=1 Tax=Pagrus major TaxID=143350 RepID=UPI003CC88715
MFVVQLMFVSLFVHQVMSSGSGRHSLWAFATYISGTTPFPEFSAVLMLDDVQVGYFDSKIDRLVRVGGQGVEGAELNLGQEAVFILRDIFSSMRKRLEMVKHRFNMTTAGVHVQQRMTGCEVLEDGQPALIMFRDGSNGQDADSLMYNMTHFTYAGGDGWEIQWSAVKRMHFQMLYSNIYLPFCARALNHLLDREKNLVRRRVRPRVRFITKQVVGGARVTCLATDFYPRHINLTLLRDSTPVDEDELTGGSVLPNGNGLYQVRKSLMVSDEELQRKHNYTCVTSHLSLDNRLEVSWRAEFSRSHRIYIISAPAGLTLAAVLLMVLLWWRRRSEGVAMETQEQQERLSVNKETDSESAGLHLSRFVPDSRGQC